MQIFWSTNNIAMQNNNWFLKDRILLDMSKSMNDQLLLSYRWIVGLVDIQWSILLCFMTVHI